MYIFIHIIGNLMNNPVLFPWTTYKLAADCMNNLLRGDASCTKCAVIKGALFKDAVGARKPVAAESEALHGVRIIMDYNANIFHSL